MTLVDANKISDEEKAIIKIIAFFDLFDYPLTPLEIWTYQDKKIALEKVINILDNLPKIARGQGFVYLPAREAIIISRQKRFNYTQRKLKIARRFTRLFSNCTWVEAVFLGNSLGAFNLRDESDIDFVIISRPGRLWLTRLYCAGLAALLNSRPRPRNKRDKICLSFYISSAHLNLDDLQLQPEDPYFFYWLRSLILLYNKNKTYEKFLRANNLPFEEDLDEQEVINQPRQSNQLNLQVNNFFNFLDKTAHRFQLAIMAPELKQAANNSVGVVLSDKVLKLYLHDNRQEYLDRYGNKLQQVFTQNNWVFNLSFCFFITLASKINFAQ